MSRKIIERIRDKVRLGQYDFTAHAVEEAAEDRLDILDVERALLSGNVTPTHRHDPRGVKYVVAGKALDGQTTVGVVGRFTSTGRYLIITVYAIAD